MNDYKELHEFFTSVQKEVEKLNQMIKSFLNRGAVRVFWVKDTSAYMTQEKRLSIMLTRSTRNLQN